MEILLIIFIMKSLQKRKIAQIYYHDPNLPEENLQSPQSDSLKYPFSNT